MEKTSFCTAASRVDIFLCIVFTDCSQYLDTRVDKTAFSRENSWTCLLRSTVMRVQQWPHSPNSNQLSWDLLMSRYRSGFLCMCVLYSCNPKQGLIKWEDKTQLPSRQAWVISHLFPPLSFLLLFISICMVYSKTTPADCNLRWKETR